MTDDRITKPGITYNWEENSFVSNCYKCERYKNLDCTGKIERRDCPIFIDKWKDENKPRFDWVLWIFFTAICLCVIGFGYSWATIEPPHDVKFTVLNKYVEYLDDGAPGRYWVIGDNFTWMDYPITIYPAGHFHPYVPYEYDMMKVGNKYNVRIEQGFSTSYKITEVTT